MERIAPLRTVSLPREDYRVAPQEGPDPRNPQERSPLRVSHTAPKGPRSGVLTGKIVQGIVQNGEAA